MPEHRRCEVQPILEALCFSWADCPPEPHRAISGGNPRSRGPGPARRGIFGGPREAPGGPGGAPGARKSRKNPKNGQKMAFFETPRARGGLCRKADLDFS